MARVKDHFHEEIIGRQWAEDHRDEPQDEMRFRKEHDMKETRSAKLHTAVAEVITDLRQELIDKEIGGHLRLDIEVEGRINDGDMKVTYTLGGTYSGDNPKGARLAPVVSEYLRRKGWNEANAPMALMAPGEFRDEPVAPNYTRAND